MEKVYIRIPNDKIYVEVGETINEESSGKRDLNPRVSKPNNDVNPKSKPTKLNTPLPPGGKKKA